MTRSGAGYLQSSVDVGEDAVVYRMAYMVPTDANEGDLSFIWKGEGSAHIVRTDI